MNNIIMEKLENIAIIKINTPGPFNVFNMEVFAEMSQCLDELCEDKSVRVVIITSERKHFAAGSDVKYMLSLDVEAGMDFTHAGVALFRKIELFKKPVIVAINGYALGGGSEIAMACDIRIASTTAVIGQPEVRIGIIPGFNGTQRMVRLLGAGRTKEIIYTAENITAEEALRIGLVNRVVEPEELISTAIALARKIAANSPLAVYAAKEAINLGVVNGMETGMALEDKLTRYCLSSEDKIEGMSAFVEKRKAVFKDR